MNRIATGLLATALSVSFAAAAIVPTEAAQTFMPQAPSVSSDVLNVEARNGDLQWIPNQGNRRNFNRNRNSGNRDFRVNRNFSGNNGGAYWNGHRGYRDYHRGYRRHGDYWFPLAAFATGALITGAIINNQNRVYRGGDDHVQWCYDRYRSYRAYDNTFQPYNGPRQQCYSPY
ncbi:BA14K family protein [Mesorhizobium sp. AR10]|uniref:BA14K family protein n=1 Tax=Mesorhizobium sp. AR10 TaxID=2865839 RepID=UPI00215F183A|nr:BA14K family protein [Mesorhizobium sp. AR10]UVK37104.1 BA14K family protein [Mesorhizobium sp. AR10]